MLTDADEVDAGLIGEDCFFDEVPNDLRVRQRLVIRSVGNVTEGVEAELDMR